MSYESVFPVITVYRNGEREQKNVYRPKSKFDMMYARWLCRDAKIGTIVFYGCIQNLEYKEHCIDFLIQRTENGWQPYVTSYYMDDSNMPMGWHFDLRDDLFDWKKADSFQKKTIHQKVSDKLGKIDVTVVPDTSL